MKIKQPEQLQFFRFIKGLLWRCQASCAVYLFCALTLAESLFTAHSVAAETFALKLKPPREINGRVTDADGVALTGASISIKGTSQGTRAGANGYFKLSASTGDVLVVSYVGYKAKEIVLTETMTMVRVSLEVQANEKLAVVVTALGIKKSTKSLTYNVQEIKGAEVTRVPDASFVNALSGKVAGITINSSASGIGGSTRVVMRGDKSINPKGNNNALYVLDGIPLPNLFTGKGGSGRYGGGDGGDGISDFNPEDFSTLTVLTGPSSAALYGGKAANGALMVALKGGSTDGKPHVSISSNTSFYNAFVLPKFQNTYGSPVGEFNSWGAKLPHSSSYNPSDFFQTGLSFYNGVGLQLGNEKNQTYISASSYNARGIIPNNIFNRYTGTFNGKYFLTDKLTLSVTGMYVNKVSQNMNAQGDYYNPLVPLYLFPRGDNINNYKIYERYNPSRGFSTQYWPYGDQGRTMQNPYWIINRNFNVNTKDRYLLAGSLRYVFTDWLNVTARIRTDRNNGLNEIKNYASTLSFLASNSDNGSYANSPSKTIQTYGDVIANINKRWKNVGILANLGTSLNTYKYNLTSDSPLSSGAPLAKVPNLFSLNNVLAGPLHQEGYKVNTQAIFANATLDYKSQVFLDLTGRNEWSSILANTPKNHVFYPSVGLSMVLSDMLKLPQHSISFLKLRGSYAEVGNAPDELAGITQKSNPVGPSGPSGNPDFPIGNLKFEKTKSEELGLSSKFLDNRLGLEFTVYNSNTYNQLINSKANPSSGFATYYVNAGKVNNKGIEASLSARLLIGELKYNPTLVFTLNRNKIKELVHNVSNPTTGGLFSRDTLDLGGLGSYENLITKGGSIGDIYVNSFAKDNNGLIYVDPLTLQMQIDNTKLLYAGNSNPKFTLGFSNEFSYKSFTLNFLLDGRFGGRVVSATQAILDGTGSSLQSAQARDRGGVLVNGVLMDAKNYYTQAGGGLGVLSNYVYSATNVRLKEVSLSYTVSKHLLWNTLKSLSFSVTGRNLLMFYNKAPFDPQSTASTSTFYQGIDYFITPSLRSMGFGIKASL